MKYTFTLFLFTIALFPAVARADIAPDPGFHYFDNCVFIDNLNDYPDYDIYVTHEWRFGPSLTEAQESPTAETGSFVCGDTTTPLIAIKKTDQSKIIHQDDPGKEHGDIWDLLEENQRYFIRAEVTGKPEITDEIDDRGALPDSNPTVAFASTYHIDTLTETTFQTHFVSFARYDADGNIVSEPTGDEAVPNQTANNLILSETATEERDSNLPVIIVLIGVIILVIAARKWRK